MEVYQTYAEAVSAWQRDRAHFEALGISFDEAAVPRSYLPEPFKRDFGLAMDAQSALSTDPNAGVPMMLTTMLDPAVFRILFAKNAAAAIVGEVRKGDWLMDTTMFPVVEHTGEVSSYGDYAENGRAGANTDWPQVQSYHFQVIKEYGERELERAGLGRINWVSEVDQAATTILARAQNVTYHFGVAGLQNYGMLNNPYLSAALTPATKASGGTAWFVGGNVNAQANEVYNDVLALFEQLVLQTGGLVKMDDKMVLAMAPASMVALGFTNTFNVNVVDLLKKNFPNLRIEPDILYGAKSAANPQGVVAGNLLQLYAEEIEGQKTAFAAFTVKMRAHPIVRQLSSFKQKMTAGTWGTVIRMPMGVAQMIGV